MMKPTELPTRLFNDIHRTLADDQARLEVQYRWILKLLLLFLCIMGLSNVIAGHWKITLLTWTLAFSYFIFYWFVYFWKYKGIILVSVLMTLETSVVYSYVLINGISDGFSAIWILIMPPISILMMGRMIGILSNIVLFSILVFFLWTPFGESLLRFDYSAVFRLRLPLIYLLLLVLNLFSETLRVHTVKQLRESRRRMDTVFRLQYENIHDRIDEARKARHDLRHHFVILNQLLDEGKIEDAKQYIDQYYKALPFEESMTYCDHYATNALLTYCQQRAKENNIPKKIQVNYPASLPFPTEDLTVIFGNLLENALDASIELKNSDSDLKPEVRVNGSFDGTVLLFSVRNYTLHKAIPAERNAYKSSKHAGAGVGLASVQGIVDKYNGTLRIEQPEGEFIVQVLLQTPKN